VKDKYDWRINYATDILFVYDYVSVTLHRLENKESQTRITGSLQSNGKRPDCDLGKVGGIQSYQ
jgi:hypothetical protein